MIQPTPDLPSLPRQKRALGWLLSGLGALIFVASIIPSIIAYTDTEEQGFWVFLASAMFVSGAYMIIYGKRHLTPVRDWTWVIQQPKPILYLRSFDAEKHDYSLGNFFGTLLHVFTARSFAYGASWWMPTLQAQLAMLMNRVGTYVAVGQPGERLPGMGAVRCYIGNDWQQRVQDLLAYASLVVLRAGTTNGLDLEMRHCKRQLRPEQLLLMLPFRNSDYASVSGLLSEKHGIALENRRQRALMIRFDADWKPKPLAPKWGLDKTLRPFFLANEIVPPKSRWWDSFRLFFQ